MAPHTDTSTRSLVCTVQALTCLAVVAKAGAKFFMRRLKYTADNVYGGSRGVTDVPYKNIYIYIQLVYVQLVYFLYGTSVTPHEPP